MTIGYTRLSTDRQNISAHLEAFTAAGCGKVFQEKTSGVRVQRPPHSKFLRRKFEM